MSNTTNLIKDLRTKTGAGFLDCKNALAETKNDVDLAIEYLRKKGLAKASKKSSREANEGAVGIYSNTEPFADFINNNHDGILVDNDIELWNKKINYLLENLDLRNQLLLNAQKRIGF